MKAKEKILQIIQCTGDAGVQIQLTRQDLGEYSTYSVKSPEDNTLGVRAVPWE